MQGAQGGGGAQGLACVGGRGAGRQGLRRFGPRPLVPLAGGPHGRGFLESSGCAAAAGAAPFWRPPGPCCSGGGWPAGCGSGGWAWEGGDGRERRESRSRQAPASAEGGRRALPTAGRGRGLPGAAAASSLTGLRRKGTRLYPGPATRVGGEPPVREKGGEAGGAPHLCGAAVAVEHVVGGVQRYRRREVPHRLVILAGREGGVALGLRARAGGGPGAAR
jgi:hypothetical protein